MCIWTRALGLAPVQRGSWARRCAAFFGWPECQLLPELHGAASPAQRHNKAARAERRVLAAEEGNFMELNVPPDDFRIQKVLQAIKADPTVRISDLASQVNLSNSRLSHLFKTQTGLSLIVFLANKRLERAADLLRDTEMRVKEITYSIGYCQEPSFNRAFRKKFDCSPLSYRKQQRE
jgi:AraC-like DNA-binding protein